MSDRSAEEVRDAFRRLYRCAVEELGVNAELEPILSLCFMSLPVIPTLKLTDQGLFDVLKQRFIQLEWTEA
jgi:adenine deaminase